MERPRRPLGSSEVVHAGRSSVQVQIDLFPPDWRRRKARARGIMWLSLERSPLREDRVLGNCPSTRDEGPGEQDKGSLCKGFIRGARDEGFAVRGSPEVVGSGLRV